MDRTATHRCIRLFPLLFAVAACAPRSDAEATRDPEAAHAGPPEASDPSSSGDPEAAVGRRGVFTMDS